VISFTLRPLYSQAKNPGTNWIGDWIGSRVGLDDMAKQLVAVGDGVSGEALREGGRTFYWSSFQRLKPVPTSKCRNRSFTNNSRI
jgi:hypothetical protein